MTAPTHTGGPPPSVDPTAVAATPEALQLDQNIAAVLEFYAREEQKLSRPQRGIERISTAVGQPAFLGAILVFAVLWIGSNLLLVRAGHESFDPAPFAWLQGIIGISALLTSLVVLIRQNRLAGLAEQRDHLDLKVTLLIEQKAAKLIHLLEELRRDLPNVRDRYDSTAAALQQSMSPDLVLAALDQPRPGASSAASQDRSATMPVASVSGMAPPDGPDAAAVATSPAAPR